MRGADEKAEDEQEQNLFMVKFEHHLLDNVALQGIRNVRKVFMRQEEATVVDPDYPLDGFQRKKEWLLDSEGINLAEVLQADNVDCRRTLSNHVVEMFEVLGIEAARLSVLKELRAVLEFDGSKVNYRCALQAACTCAMHVHCQIVS
jgi:DNA-directed RNA polymerase II subunit RPB1